MISMKREMCIKYLENAQNSHLGYFRATKWSWDVSFLKVSYVVKETAECFIWENILLSVHLDILFFRNSCFIPKTNQRSKSFLLLLLPLWCAVTLEGPRSSLTTSPSSSYFLGSSMWTLVHQSAEQIVFVDNQVVLMLMLVCRLQGSQPVDGQV